MKKITTYFNSLKGYEKVLYILQLITAFVFFVFAILAITHKYNSTFNFVYLFAGISFCIGSVRKFKEQKALSITELVVGIIFIIYVVLDFFIL
jgi:succinate-acetate transporter protein